MKISKWSLALVIVWSFIAGCEFKKWDIKNGYAAGYKTGDHMRKFLQPTQNGE